MSSVILAFSGSLIYGASDFFGGIGARRWSSMAVTFVSSVVGLIVLVVASLVVPTAWSGGVFLWGVLAGLAGAGSLIFLYACLAIGPMSILAPIVGLISATLPVFVGLATGEQLGASGLAGIVLGLVAIVLICLTPDRRALRPSVRGILLAIGSGTCVGLYLVFIDLSPSDSGPAPLTVVFAVSVVATGAAAGVRHIVARVRNAPRRDTRVIAPDRAARLSAATSPTTISRAPSTAPSTGHATTPSAGQATISSTARSPIPPAGPQSDRNRLRQPDGSTGMAPKPVIGADAIVRSATVAADPDPAPRMHPLVAAILAGLTDAPATIMFLVALRIGDLAVVSVLSALSPAGTVVLAAILLRERIALIQWLGLLAALGAAALLSIP